MVIGLVIVTVSLFVGTSLQLSSKEIYCNPSRCPAGTVHIACEYEAWPASWNQTGFCKEFNDSLSVVSWDQQQKILDLHNNLRRQVANGWEYRGASGPQPTAANMKQLVWDPSLATFAQTLVKQCLIRKDMCRNTDKTIGQNMYAAVSWEPFKSVDWATTIEKVWYNGQVSRVSEAQVKIYKNNISSPIDQYAQLVWAQTRTVGCAVATFKDILSYKQFYVCNYGPAIVEGSPMYEIGETASNCYMDFDNNGLCAV